MQHTLLSGTRPSVVPHRALGYTRRSNGAYDLAHDDGADDTGNGGLWTSIEDLARWDRNFYDPQVGGQKLLAELRRRERLNDGFVLSYAAGLDTDDRCGLAREQHGGDDFGFHSLWVRYPTERLSVVVACNFEPVDPTALAEEVTTALLGPCNPAPPVSAHALAPIEGRFVAEDTLDVRVLRKDGDKLLLEFQNASIPARELVAIDGKTFIVKGRNSTRYSIEPATRSSPALLIRTTGHARTKFIRTEPYRLQPRGLPEYAGRYFSDSVKRDIEIVVQSDQLLVRPFGRLTGRPLVPVIRDGFVAGETAFLFQRDARNRVNALLTRSERVRRLEWKRR